MTPARRREHRGPRVARRVVLATAAALTCMTAPGLAQVEPVDLYSSALRIRLSGRLHMQWNTTSVDSIGGTDFIFRRSRLTFDITSTFRVNLRWMIDFTEFNEVGVRDAYANVAFSDAFRLTLGQFKRPFDAFQLASSNRLAVIEREGRVRGVSDCLVIEDLCTYSRLLVDLQYVDRDIGVMVDGVFGGKWGYRASATNGTGQNTSDENGAKSYSGRITYRLRDNVRLGTSAALHDYPNDSTGNDEYAPAVNFDVEVGSYEGRYHLFAALAWGGFWSNLDAAGDPSAGRSRLGATSSLSSRWGG
jgi:phosphate-selective porin